ncbi:uncharacterized protein PV09_00167 [Verruconis gallopava]|uniref:Uncharacterized protein n=1 Tax=Verruconis gallopava TaxID=253628 RepID=A0A0D1Y2G0_9PEZI|nr:uncharacterized protein PV09_00167 [Verruconis gallopava]KIW09241.1 hypothetical protein PV09_00167 [Verruconis gallopava]
MSKQNSTGNRSITDWFKPNPTIAAASQRSSELTPRNVPYSVTTRTDALNSQDHPSVKRQRLSSEGRWLSPSPPSSPSTLVASSAEAVDGAASALTDANVSFASIRSNTSSKRITVSNGEEVVRGSDTETDDDLEDLDAILNKGRLKPKPLTTTSHSNESTVPANVVPRPQEKKRIHKFNLGALVEEKRRQTAMEVRIAEAQANLHEAGVSEDAVRGTKDMTPKKETIKAVLAESNDAEDGSKARRVMDALQRTEAFEREDVWHFFEDRPPQNKPRNPFPKISHPNAMLQMILNDPQRRQQAFASGFIQRIAEKIPLPEELLSWLMIEVCRESRDVLVFAYIETLSQAARPSSALLSEESLKRCFQALGVRSEALDFQRPVQHTRELKKKQSSVAGSNIVFFVHLLQKLCVRLPLPSKDLAAHFLIRSSFDQSILSCSQARFHIERCFRDLLDAFAEGPELDEAFSRILNSTFESVQAPSLRQQLLAALPASSFRAHHFRRLLAVAFALDKRKFLKSSLHNPALTARMLLLFEASSPLRVTSSTDYSELRARLSMLDVAIDVGFSDFAFLDQETGGDSSDRRQVEKKFNQGIDRLANAVRDLTARIVDAGAAHMSRTEAKILAERVAQRLEFGVRTRERPPKDWFCEIDRMNKMAFMKGWMGKNEETAPEAGVPQANEDRTKVEASVPPKPDDDGPKEPSDPKNDLSNQKRNVLDVQALEEPPQGTFPAHQMAIRSTTAVAAAKKRKNRMLVVRF